MNSTSDMATNETDKDEDDVIGTPPQDLEGDVDETAETVELRRADSTVDHPADEPSSEPRPDDTHDGMTSLFERFVHGPTVRDGDDRAPVHPRQVGLYTVLDVLGEGGMGVVYRAEQKTPIRRRVALKVIKRGMDTNEVIARFESERQALALMNHANIARVLDAGSTADGRPFFAMEHVPGLPITEYCDRHKLNVRRRLELCVQVAQGIHHAHRQGIIHRDLKPSNVLVSTQDGEPAAKIIDFGVAKATNQRLTERTVYTEIGRTVGTPAYMSPEQAETSVEDVDRRSDVYALGVLLYELLVSELPIDPDYSRKNALEEVLRRIREEEPAYPSVRWLKLNPETTTLMAAKRNLSPSAVQAQLSGDLDWIVMKALEKEPERRYQTALEMADDLKRYLAGDAVLAGRPGTLYRLRKLSRKHRGPVLATVTVLLTLILGLIGSLIFYFRAEEQAEELRSLSDVKRLEKLQDDRLGLRELPYLERHGAMETWLIAAREVASRYDDHTNTLARLRQQTMEDASKGATPGGSNDSDASEWQQEILSELVGKLERFRSQATSDGTLAEVENLLERSPSKEMIERRREEARQSIANDEGLEIQLPPGLYPIGRDPSSGRWEFVDLRYGLLSERGKDGQIKVDADSAPVFVLLLGGRFQMGSPPDEPDREKGDEELLHDATVSPFLISKYEITQAIWTRIAGDNPSRFPGGERPVDNVNWEQSRSFAKKMGCDLPTEAQWEYACRAGTRGPYSGTGLLSEMGWYDDNSGGATHPVGLKSPNQFGLYDLHGNVMEWCRDAFSEDFYRRPEASRLDPICTEGNGRVLRGGSYRGSARHCRSGDRYYKDPTLPLSPQEIGFRVTRDIQILAAGGKTQ